ncbi:MAG: hypothetical protein ACLUOS_16100 [Odoribacter splanchnicus]
MRVWTHLPQFNSSKIYNLVI